MPRGSQEGLSLGVTRAWYTRDVRAGPTPNLVRPAVHEAAAASAEMTNS
jgi:hypothetical protein